MLEREELGAAGWRRSQSSVPSTSVSSKYLYQYSTLTNNLLPTSITSTCSLARTPPRRQEGGGRGAIMLVSQSVSRKQQIIDQERVSLSRYLPASRKRRTHPASLFPISHKEFIDQTSGYYSLRTAAHSLLHSLSSLLLHTSSEQTIEE